MSSFDVRYMTVSDLPFFIKECKKSAHDKHLNSELLEPRKSKEFEAQIKSILSLQEQGIFNVDFLLMLVCKIDKQPVGFMWIKSAIDTSGAACIDIKLIHIIESMRGRGGGSELLSIALQHYKKNRLTATCFYSSITMSEMLKRRGFKVVKMSPSGTNFFCLFPD